MLRPRRLGAGPARRRWLLGSIGALLVLAGAGEALSILNRDTWLQLADAIGFGSVCTITYGSLGTLILARKPGNPVGRVFLALAWITVVSEVAGEYALWSYTTLHASLPGAAAAAWFSGWSFFLAWPFGLTLIFLVFPDGMPPGRFWRLVLALAAAGCALLALTALLAPGPIQPSNRVYVDPLSVTNVTGFLPADLDGTLNTAGWFTSGAALILGVGAAVLRLRGATGERRQQLRWMAYFAAPVAPAFAAHFITLVVLHAADRDYAFAVYFVIFLIGVPAATAIAVLRYRLYGLDVVISRALVYATLAAGITAVYVGIAVGIGNVVGSGGRPNLGLSIVATSIIAVAFQPVRERLQHVANRLVYGQRATPYEVLSQFSARIGGNYAADDVLERMAKVIAVGSGSRRAEVWARAGSALRCAAAWPDHAAPAALALRGGDVPEIPGADLAAPVYHDGELLGMLAIAKRSGESLTPIEGKLVSDLAMQAGLVLKNAGLAAELAARVDDLRASRQRLVAAQDQERRRLERNLHDGAQQQLVALKVRLGIAEKLADSDPGRAQQAIADAKADTDDALENLRALARGIYPPLLAEKGLALALEAHARRALLPITVAADGIGRYSQDLEATVYFCCLEALQNAQKYARATQATISLVQSDGHVRFSVSDDGVGFDATTTTRGAGLQNMEDRLEAVGGALDISSAAGAGTTLSGSIPVAY